MQNTWQTLFPSLAFIAVISILFAQTLELICLWIGYLSPWCTSQQCLTVCIRCYYLRMHESNSSVWTNDNCLHRLWMKLSVTFIYPLPHPICTMALGVGASGVFCDKQVTSLPNFSMGFSFCFHGGCFVNSRENWTFPSQFSTHPPC